MTLLSGLFERKAAGFGTNSGPTTLTPYDDIITSSRILDMLGAINLTGDYSATYEEIVRCQLWVRVAVNKISHAIGYLPLKTYTKGAQNQRERAPDSALAALLAVPNTTKLTGDPVAFQAQIASDLLTFANAIIVKVQARPDVPPTELRPRTPRGWVVDNNGDYVWKSPFSSQEERFKDWQIIHITEPSPSYKGFGVSRLEAARLTLAIEHAAQKLGASTFQNGARPGGIINVRNLPTGDKQRRDAVERLKSEVMARFGGSNNAGLPAVLEGETTWHAMTHNLDDSAVVAHRQLTRMEVAALFDIPQPAIGILDEANFASVDALHQMFYQDTLSWWVRLIESAFKSQLIAGVPAFADHYAEFDMDAFMRGSFLQRMQGHQIAINAGFRTSDEARELENDPPMAAKQPEAGMLRFPLNYSVSPAAAGQAEQPGQGGP